MCLFVRAAELMVRKIPSPRMDFSIGKGQSLFPEWMLGNIELRLVLQNEKGESVFGCAADWPSFGWLDKRTDVPPKTKLTQLLQLLIKAADKFRKVQEINSPFAIWHKFHTEFSNSPDCHPVSLCNSFATALFERAMIDASCRMRQQSFFESLQQNQLGFEPGSIYPELSGFDWQATLPDRLPQHLCIRHTVGLGDPLFDSELDDDNRIGDGQPQTLEQYIKQHGIHYFKIKVKGQIESDFARLSQVWELAKSNNPMLTLDGNESFESATQLSEFVKRLRNDLPHLFERILFLEQPLNRQATMDASTAETIRAVSKLVPLAIDEADGYVTAFADAVDIGYTGVSHKNCKGVFKSLANFALARKIAADTGKPLFVTAEDLTNMPLVAHQQDLAVVAALGIQHAERNGHHYFNGLSHLSDAERHNAKMHLSRLYRFEGDDGFLNVVDGKIDIRDLFGVGLGVVDQPDWGAMSNIEEWIAALAE